MTSLFIAAALSMGIAHAPQQSHLVMYQLDLFCDAGAQPFSNWGACDLHYQWHGFPMYFNLSVNGLWGVRNVAVFSGRDLGQMDVLRFNFPLPIAPGQPFPVGQVGYTLTTSPVGAPPPGPTMPFMPIQYEMYSGAAGGQITIVPPEPLIGCVIQDAPVAHKDFPNQDCGPLECGPAAVSNSLKFLSAKHNMGLPDADLGIDKMKGATGWRRDVGVPKDSWYKIKDKYCKLRPAGAAKGQIPVTTRRFGNHEMGKMIQEIRDGQDVELTTDTHIMALVGIAECANGYTIQIAHDTDQRKAGGNVTESGTFEQNSRRLKGFPGQQNSIVRHIIVECPET